MRRQYPLLLIILFLLSGCAHVISKDIRSHSDPSLTLRQVRQNPDDYKGKSVVWGGDIVQTINQKDGTTLIEVFQRPLGWRGEPRETLSSDGRFLILVEKYLDPYIYQKGRRSLWLVKFWGRRSNLLVKWVTNMPFF